MIDELDALERRISEIVAYCNRLQAENDSLRERLVSAQADNAQLTERMLAAGTRLQQLIDQLPEAKP
ncbi:MAG TPA: hypothetical protein PKY22_08560 [Accumulibacter sp.]|nr:hypothetical protein [Accumulibacter sp.]